MTRSARPSSVAGMTEAPPTPTLPRVVATRYVLPLREGGSLPGLMEADDLGTYVVKFRGAGQGGKALVAEVVCASLARGLGLRVPDLVLVELDPLLGRAEPDQEVQDLLRASAGTNLGVDYLPGSLGFDPAVDAIDPAEAAVVVWFDALVQNVDRSWRNPNILRWHGRLWLIDHGAALYFAHAWERRAGAATRPYTHIDEHVLLPVAGSILDADARLADRLDDALLRAALSAVPDEWLTDEPGFSSPDEVRDAYAEVLTSRLAERAAWLPQLEVARAAL
jgi:hypothetical protein